MTLMTTEIIPLTLDVDGVYRIGKTKSIATFKSDSDTPT